MNSREDLIDSLREINWQSLGIHLLILHGSALRKNRPRDIDLIIIADPVVDEEDLAIKVMEEVERRTMIEADIYFIKDPNEVNCFLLQEALRNSVIIYQNEIGRKTLITSINICYDFMLSREKLRYTENLVESVLRNAPR